MLQVGALFKSSDSNIGSSHGNISTGNVVSSLVRPWDENTNDGDGTKIRTYWWRWVVLMVFSLNLTLNMWIWIIAAPIADVFRCYYGVSNFWVNAVTLSSNIVYILFAFPAALFLDRYGLRVTMISAALTNALGTSLRVIGTGMFC